MSETPEDDRPMNAVELDLAEHFRNMGCVDSAGVVVDPVDLEDCAGMAVEVIRFLRLGGWMADKDAAYAAGRKDGYGQGRDDEANGEDLPEWYRLATGEICRPGQPYGCGDFHHNGKCVREVCTDA